MKALLLNNKPFLPSIDGGNSATKAFVMQLLEEGFKLNYLTFSSEKHPFKEHLFLADKWKEINAKHVPISLKIKPWPAFLALLNGKSYQLSRFESEQMEETFRKLSANQNFDFVLLDSLYAAQSIEKFKTYAPKSTFVLRAHNVESKLTKTKGDASTNILSKLYLTILSKQLEKRERKILSKCDLVLSISEDDSKIFRSWGHKKVQTLPFFPERSDVLWSDKPNLFSFFGAMNWQPNVEALNSLEINLFPEIQKLNPDISLKVAGSFMENRLLSKNKAISNLGFVENKFDFLANNGVLLAPIRRGSGVRVKIIEALSIGVPVVTTVTGAQGIPVKDNFGLIVCHSDQEFIEKSAELSSNKAKREELSNQALIFYSNWRSEFSLTAILKSYV